MKKLLTLAIILVTLAGCERAFLEQPLVVDGIEHNTTYGTSGSRFQTYRYKVTFEDYAGWESYFYTNTKYQVGDTLK